MQKKNNEEISISFVVSNPNTNGQSAVNKNQSFVQKVLGFFYGHFNACVRVFACLCVIGTVFFGIHDSIENYKLMGGMGINPIETVFLGLVSVVFSIIKYYVPIILVLLMIGVFAHKKITGKMPKILPVDVRLALLIGGVCGIFIGVYFYHAFVVGGHINNTLFNTSGQVGILVFLVIFFVLLALFNLCNIGKDAKNVVVKNERK